MNDYVVILYFIIVTVILFNTAILAVRPILKKHLKSNVGRKFFDEHQQRMLLSNMLKYSIARIIFSILIVTI